MQFIIFRTIWHANNGKTCKHNTTNLWNQINYLFKVMLMHWNSWNGTGMWVIQIKPIIIFRINIPKANIPKIVPNHNHCGIATRQKPQIHYPPRHNSHNILQIQTHRPQFQSQTLTLYRIPATKFLLFMRRFLWNPQNSLY